MSYKNETKNCQNCKKDFTIEPDDFNFYEKIKVPPPTFCPECRMTRRFLWYNERYFFRRLDSRTGENIFSSFPPGVEAKIWDLSYWNGDNWDPMEYGQDYDFSRPFFEQFREFMNRVPWPSKSAFRMINSDYSDQANDFKNSYLCFSGQGVEDSAYVVQGVEVKNSLDLYQARHTEFSYDSYMVDESYRVMFSVNCEESLEIWFSKDLQGCSNCFGCIGLRNKSYYIFNQPYSKEEYQAYLAKFNLKSHKTIIELKKNAHEFWLKYPVKFALMIKCIDSTGEHIEHSKNLKQCYSVHESQDLAYSQFISPPASDSYDYTNMGFGSSLMYESVFCGEECNLVKFCWRCWPSSHDLEYSMLCQSSTNLFGCVGLKKKQYCIFNKQYIKEEYNKLVEKIKKQMNDVPYVDSFGNVYGYGEFFPPELSPFAYNESSAGDFFPLSQGEAKEKGFFWREKEMRKYETTLTTSDIPDSIDDVSDDILNEIIKCSGCDKPYRIISTELQFYRNVGLPLPRLCIDCRFTERFKFVNPPKFWPGRCQCAGSGSLPRDDGYVYKNNNTDHISHLATESCTNEFSTSYAPERPEIVYCEKCYQQEVY